MAENPPWALRREEKGERGTEVGVTKKGVEEEKKENVMKGCPSLKIGDCTVSPERVLASN